MFQWLFSDNRNQFKVEKNINKINQIFIKMQKIKEVENQSEQKYTYMFNK